MLESRLGRHRQRRRRPSDHEEQEHERQMTQDRLRAPFVVGSLQGGDGHGAAEVVLTADERVDLDLLGDVRRSRRDDAIRRQREADEQAEQDRGRNDDRSQERREFHEAMTLRCVKVDVDGGCEDEDDEGHPVAEDIVADDRSLQVSSTDLLADNSTNRLSMLLCHFLIDDVCANDKPE